MRSMAQKRLTAVGRVSASVFAMTATSSLRVAMSVALLWLTPRAKPMAAETPMAGAPRTIMSRMTVATCW
jgi:hypothetical protein